MIPVLTPRWRNAPDSKASRAVAMVAAKELTEDDLHHVFAVECRGDTLIITPRGDAHGFPESHFRGAVHALRGRFGNGQPRNLIIDLSTRDYPGLEMLGAFRDLIETVRLRGGTAAVVGVSPDTTLVMEEFELGRDWTVRPDLPTAAREVVHEPLRHRLWRHRLVVLLTAVAIFLVSVVAVFLMAIEHRPMAIAYHELSDIWAEYRRISPLPSDLALRDRRLDELADRAGQLATTLDEGRVGSAKESARRMEAILRSDQQPNPRAAEYEKDLIVMLRRLENADRRPAALRLGRQFELLAERPR